MTDDLLPASFSSGLSSFQAGDKAKAELIFRDIFSWHPEPAARAAHLMGMLEHKAGNRDAAIQWWRQGVVQGGGVPESHVMLARTLEGMGELAQAVAVCEQGVVRFPSSGILWLTAAGCLVRAMRVEEAAEAAHRSVQLDPTPDRLLLLGELFQSLSRFEESKVVLEEVRKQCPGDAKSAHLLGVALRETKRPLEALAADEEAIRLAPLTGGLHYELARLLLVDMGRPQDAIAAMEQALICNPGDAYCHSHLLLAQHYQGAQDPEQTRSRHEAWAHRHGQFPWLSQGQAPGLAGRKIRVGYVSADLYGTHPIVSFFENIIRHHDRNRFEVFLYSDANKPHANSDRILAKADQARMTWTLDDAQLADRIHRDQVDILVDLGGHAGRRLGMFARKPAPIQATYLGYPDTTGLPAMDYRLVDAITDPAGEADAWNTEKLIRLPGCFLTYRPPAFAPEVGPPPFETNGFVTFVSFNIFAKVTPEWAAHVAAILAWVPDSRLLFKSLGFLDPQEVQSRLDRLFAPCGIGSDRISFQLEEPDPLKHLPHYARADIALDTFPYNGTTTTCEALWMGVPVVSLAGKSHVSRVGASLLSCVGLPELSARTPEEFIAIAAGLAADLPKLRRLRSTLRERMGPLTDGAAFASKLEFAYHQMAATLDEP